MPDPFEQHRRELDELEERYRLEMDKFWREFEADKLRALSEWGEAEASYKERCALAQRQFDAGISSARARIAEAETAARR